MEALARRVGVPSAKLVSTIGHMGNTSAASIPLALCEAASDGRLRPGSVVLMTAFGGGMTGASAVLRWGSR
jgi:3-oxoacyl-[acyl-carrier-protein] synthase-3